MTGLDCIIVRNKSGLFMNACIMGLSAPMPACTQSQTFKNLEAKLCSGRGSIQRKKKKPHWQ